MLKLKLILLWPWWKLKGARARRLVKKALKNENRYSEQYKFDYVLKRAKKVLKAFRVNMIVRGRQNLPTKGAALITPNHASLLDSALLIAMLEKQTYEKDVQNRMVSFLAKNDLAQNKNYAGYANLLKTFYLDRKNPRAALKLMDQIGPYLKTENKLFVIFPAGTRDPNGQVGTFKAGAFRLAKKDFLPIIPVTINNSLSISNLQRKGKIDVEIIIHRPLKPMSIVGQTTQSIAKRVETVVASSWTKPSGKRAKTEQSV